MSSKHLKIIPGMRRVKDKALFEAIIILTEHVGFGFKYKFGDGSKDDGEDADVYNAYDLRKWTDDDGLFKSNYLLLFDRYDKTSTLFSRYCLWAKWYDRKRDLFEDFKRIQSYK